jgi:CspA family cold shock protein
VHGHFWRRLRKTNSKIKSGYRLTRRPIGEGQISTGRVKWLNESKGYGFIRPDSGGKDLFVHQSEIQPEDRASIREGQQVEYEIGEGVKGGPCAANVCLCRS